MQRFRPYFSHLKPVWLRFTLALFAGGIASFASGFGLPFMTKEVFPLIFMDATTKKMAELPGWMHWIFTLFGQQDPTTQSIVLLACMMLPLVFVLRGVFGYINTYLINETGLCVLESIRLSVFARLQTLSLSFHQRHKEGDLLTRVMTDTFQIQTVIVRVSSDLIIQPMTLLSALAFLAYAALTDSRVFFILIALLSLPLCVLPIRWAGKKLLRKAQSLQTKVGDMTATVSENLSSQREVRAYNMQNQQVEALRGLSESFLRFQMGVIKYRYLISPVIEIVAALSISFAIFFGARHGMTLQSFIALVMALYLAYEPVKKIGSIHSLVKQGEASLNRIEEILLSHEEIVENAPAYTPEKIEGNIKLKHISFSYQKEDLPALQSVNINIPKGQTVALVGPSGAGKTTFASLIPRFYDPTQGTVLIDGYDIKTLSKNSLRSHIALVSQNPLLFRGSVYDNIRIGNPHASQQDIISAAQKAHAHDFILELPEGYDTLLGDHGEGLSGGQRQRIAIARAFLKDAPILILDEATSALDTQSESLIQKELQLLAKGRTTLLIAHRFSSIRHAQRILVFQEGRIIGDGNHETLYRDCPLYAALYDGQRK